MLRNTQNRMVRILLTVGMLVLPGCVAELVNKNPGITTYKIINSEHNFSSNGILLYFTRKPDSTFEFYDYNGIKLMPTFNPAYLLRDPTKKREVWEDMKKVRDYLNLNK